MNKYLTLSQLKKIGFRKIGKNCRISKSISTHNLIGTLGNLIDRIRLGYVIDFINIHIIPVFNIADICINLAVACFLYDMFFNNKKNVPS